MFPMMRAFERGVVQNSTMRSSGRLRFPRTAAPIPDISRATGARGRAARFQGPGVHRGCPETTLLNDENDRAGHVQDRAYAGVRVLAAASDVPADHGLH